jgi:tRNA-dihydrouridine synthase 3
MDESPAELVVDTEKLSMESPPSNNSQPTPEELAAKAIAPVKKEFLRPPPPRPSSTSTGLQNYTVSQTKVVSGKEKKSKRQLRPRRERP